MAANSKPRHPERNLDRLAQRPNNQRCFEGVEQIIRGRLRYSGEAQVSIRLAAHWTQMMLDDDHVAMCSRVDDQLCYWFSEVPYACADRRERFPDNGD